MQEKKHIITIAGKPASGKSTTAKMIAAKLGYTHYSTGELFREIAADQQLDVIGGNLHAEHDLTLDAKVDERQKRLGISEDRFAIDARLGWHFIPQSFKVYLDLDTVIGAERILSKPDSSRESTEHIPDNPLEYARILDERLALESNRYEKLYGVDGHDHANFDIVVDTKNNNPEQATELIIDAFNRWLAD